MIVIVGTTTTVLLLLLLLLLLAGCSTTITSNTVSAAAATTDGDNDECHIISHDRTCISFPNDINDDNKKYKYYENMEDINDFANTANTNTKEDKDDDNDFICGVYLAKSTLIGTGIGMYAGSKGYEPGEVITKRLGDHIIPIIDLKTTHQYYNPSQIYKDDEDEDDDDDDDEDSEGTAIIVPDNQNYFLWDQYTVRHQTKQEFV